LEWFDAQVVALDINSMEQGSAIAENFTDLFDAANSPRGALHARTLGRNRRLQSAINVFAYRELSAQLRPASVWWTEGSEGFSACLAQMVACRLRSDLRHAEWWRAEQGWSIWVISAELN